MNFESVEDMLRQFEGINIEDWHRVGVAAVARIVRSEISAADGQDKERLRTRLMEKIHSTRYEFKMCSL